MLSPTYDTATALCHTDEIVTPTYEIGVLWLCHTDEMLSTEAYIRHWLLRYYLDLVKIIARYEKIIA